MFETRGIKHLDTDAASPSPDSMAGVFALLKGTAGTADVSLSSAAAARGWMVSAETRGGHKSSQLIHFPVPSLFRRRLSRY